MSSSSSSAPAGAEEFVRATGKLPAPDLRAPDPEGTEHVLAILRERGVLTDETLAFLRLRYADLSWLLKGDLLERVLERGKHPFSTARERVDAMYAMHRVTSSPEWQEAFARDGHKTVVDLFAQFPELGRHYRDLFYALCHNKLSARMLDIMAQTMLRLELEAPGREERDVILAEAELAMHHDGGAAYMEQMRAAGYVTDDGRPDVARVVREHREKADAAYASALAPKPGDAAAVPRRVRRAAPHLPPLAGSLTRTGRRFRA